MDSHISKLRAAIDRGEVVAFFGAGVSRRAGYREWSTLLLELAGKVGLATMPMTDDPLWNAEEIRLRFRDDAAFRQAIADFYAPQGPIEDAAIRDLVNLPFRHFITTNYDDVIERVDPTITSIEWNDEAKVRALITSTGGGSDRVCLHVHGIYSKPESIVLCETDYSRRYVESLTAQRKLFALLATQRIAFFGFSLNDPAFLEILRVCRATLGGGDPRHFAVLPLEGGKATAKTVLRQWLNQKYDIEPIYFQEGHYEQFAKIVMSLVHGTAEERMLENTDPHKNEFGGSSEANGRRLSATVTTDPIRTDWFVVGLTVAPVNDDAPAIATPVHFHLHPTFTPHVHTVTPSNGTATVSITAYGAFTVGVTIDGEATRLELDLSEVPGAPQAFLER